MTKTRFEQFLRDNLSRFKSPSLKDVIQVASDHLFEENSLKNSEIKQIHNYLYSIKGQPEGRLYLECLDYGEFETRIAISETFEAIIKIFNQAYYQGDSFVSDETYDHFQNFLESLRTEYAFTLEALDSVGYELDQSVEKIKHEKKMLSLLKIYSEEDLNKWVGENEVLSLFKIDGNSCSLIYEDGKLRIAKTRGNGVYGENVFNKLYLIPDVPKFLDNKKKIEVRGEVYITQSNFLKLSEEMERLGLEKPSSQRNIVSGLLIRKENIDLSKYLSFQSFDLIGIDSFKKESEKLNMLKSLGFKIPVAQIHSDLKSIKPFLIIAKDFMENGQYLIDGLVFVYNDLKVQNELGEAAKYPKYKIAFKFAGETKETSINNIEWGVSRNGLLTPVAIVEPVELSSAMISRVTLHNFGVVKTHELKKGDLIEITRSGEVIPKFVRLISSSEEQFSYPQNCPSCNSKLVIEDIWLICLNDSCPEKVRGEILNYIEKAGIEDLSGKRLEEMINKKIVSRIEDLYKLKITDFYLLDKVKEKLANKLFESIKKSKKQTLAQFMTAIGIDGVSTTKSEKIISQGYNSLDKILLLDQVKMENIEGFAEKSSEAFLRSIDTKRELIKNLLKLGVEVTVDESSTGEGPLKDKKFCITGELSMNRTEFEKLIKKNGGVMVSSVSKNTSYLITNETESSSSKFVKAKDLGIPIINENKLLKMIEE